LLHDLGTVHQAPSSVRHEIGLRLAPGAQCGRPFLGALHVEDLLADLDHTAVDDAGGDRRYLARGHGQHGFVEDGQPRMGISQADECPSLGLAGHDHEIGIRVLGADLGSLREGGTRAGVVALVVKLEPDGDQ
jgi:hypothetical protein